MTRADGYLLDNQQTEAGRRFEALAALFDPTTFRHMERFGVGSGWRCWEVGAGGTSEGEVVFNTSMTGFRRSSPIHRTRVRLSP